MTENPLGYEKISKLLKNFAVPSIVASLVGSIYNIVDQIFIGQGVGYLGNAATNVAYPFSTICLAIALLVGIGSASRVSLCLGCRNVKKCAVGKHPKSEKHGNTAQFSEVERSGTQENCGGIGSGCRLRLRPLPVLRRRQSQRVARIDPNAVVVDKNIAENDRFDLFSRQLVCRDLVDLLFFERGEKTFHPCVVEAMSDAAEALYHAAARQLYAKGCAGVLTPAI